MKNRVYSVMLLGAALMLLGCGSDPAINATDDSGGSSQAVKIGSHVITLEFGASASLGPTTSVTFTDVPHDSRCPSDVTCIWEGAGTVRLQLESTLIDPPFVDIIDVTAYGDCPGAGHRCAPPLDTLGYRFQLLNLDPYPVSDVPIEKEDYVATLAIFPYELPDDVDGPVLIDVDPQPNETAAGVDEAYIEGDILHVLTQYSGGCKDHEFKVYMVPPTFFESHPVQADVYLRGVAVDDPCEAYIMDRLTFDLRPIAYLYEIMYGELDCIHINVHPATGRDSNGRISLLYRPAGANDSPWCGEDRR